MIFQSAPENGHEQLARVAPIGRGVGVTHQVIDQRCDDTPPIAKVVDIEFFHHCLGRADDGRHVRNGAASEPQQQVFIFRGERPRVKVAKVIWVIGIKVAVAHQVDDKFQTR
ncbi:hypothetical protein D3C84_754820 [compost metagenome]